MAQQDNGFQFSRQSRAGALVLLGILLAMAVIWRLLPAWQQPRADPREQELQQAWTQFKKENSTEDLPDDDREEGSRYYRDANAAPVAVRLAPFDPNTAGEEQLVALGLPLRTARTLIKYRSKGGRFRRREDLQKLYTLSKKDYERIAPYVRIAGETGGNSGYPSETTMPAAPVPVEAPKQVALNEANAEALIALRGIGPGYAKRILGFREALGGFIRVEQLQEVYGFPDSTYQQLKDKFLVDPGKIRRINVNTATEEELARHPYIGKKMAGNIVKLRNDLKNYTDIEQLRQVPLINEEKYRKIAPYLSTY